MTHQTLLSLAALPFLALAAHAGQPTGPSRAERVSAISRTAASEGFLSACGTEFGPVGPGLVEAIAHPASRDALRDLHAAIRSRNRGATAPEDCTGDAVAWHLGVLERSRGVAQ